MEACLLTLKKCKKCSLRHAETKASVNLLSSRDSLCHWKWWLCSDPTTVSSSPSWFLSVRDSKHLALGCSATRKHLSSKWWPCLLVPETWWTKTPCPTLTLHLHLLEDSASRLLPLLAMDWSLMLKWTWWEQTPTWLSTLSVFRKTSKTSMSNTNSKEFICLVICTVYLKKSPLGSKWAML